MTKQANFQKQANKPAPTGTGNPADDLVLIKYVFDDHALWGRVLINGKEYGYTWRYKEVFQAMYECGLVDFEEIPGSDYVNVLIEKRDYFTGEFRTAKFQVYPEDHVTAFAVYDLEKILTHMWNDKEWKTQFFTPKPVAA